MLLRELLENDVSLRVTLLEHHSKIIIEEKYRERVTVIRGTFEEAQMVPGIDAVVHLAAMTHANDKSLYRKINTEGTEVLLRSAKVSGVKHFVFVSTTALGASCGAYGESKREAEKVIASSEVPHTIVRFSEVYGGESNEGIERLIGTVRRHPLIPAVTGAFLAPLYIDDAIAALRSIVYSESTNKTYIIAGPEKLAFAEVVRTIAKVFGRKIAVISVPQSVLRALRGLPIFFSVTDQVERLICKKDYKNSAAVQDLDFSPRTFSEGLRDGYK